MVFLDTDVEGRALRLAGLVAPVLSGEADISIATLPQQATSSSGHGFVIPGWRVTEFCKQRIGKQSSRYLATEPSPRRHSLGRATGARVGG